MIQDGYSYVLGDARLRSGMDQGTPKVRKRFSYMPDLVSGVFYMDEAQKERFKAFLKVDLDGAVLPFTLPAQDGNGTWVVQFGEEMPGWTPVTDVVWACRITNLLVLPQ